MYKYLCSPALGKASLPVAGSSQGLGRGKGVWPAGACDRLGSGDGNKGKTLRIAQVPSTTWHRAVAGVRAK